jgi:hypothetical protein
LRQPPVQAESRVHLRELLSVAAGGVVFTTLHKFFPEEKGDRHPTLSERRNIVVIADEAHRSQYDFIDGYARHMRDAAAARLFHRVDRKGARGRSPAPRRRLRRLEVALRVARARCELRHARRELRLLGEAAGSSRRMRA